MFISVLTKDPCALHRRYPGASIARTTAKYVERHLSSDYAHSARSIYNATGFFYLSRKSEDGRKSSESNAHLKKQSITIKKLTAIKFFNRTSIISGKDMVADGGEAMWWGTITFWLSVLFCKLGAHGRPGE